MGFTSEDAREEARRYRERQMYPPRHDPGMFIDDREFENFGSHPNSSDDSLANWYPRPVESVPSNSSEAWGSQFGSPSPIPGTFLPPPKPKETLSDEDRFWAVVTAICKGALNFFSEFVKSFQSINYEIVMHFGRNTYLFSGVIVVLAVIFLLIGQPKIGLQLLASALFASGIGTIFFMSAYSIYSEKGPIIKEEPIPEAEKECDDEIEDEEEEVEVENGYTDTAHALRILSDDDDDFPSPIDDEPSYSDPHDTMEMVLSNMDGNNGMVTRQYLYEHIINCLTAVNPEYDAVREIDESDPEFDEWDARIQQCAEIIKTGSSDDLPYLISLKDKLFYISLELQRVKWLKNVQAFVDELVNDYSFDRETQRLKEGVYGIGTVAGDKIYVKIMKGESALVSIKDTYSRVKNNLLDTKNYMPVVFGINQEGEVVWQDLKKLNSMLVSGMPRSGKSWFMKSILAQMMFWLKPSELQFILLDPKGDISDFTTIKTPHIRKFVSTDEAIVKELRYIVQEEAPRRKKLLKDYGVIDFWDLKRTHPEVDFPIIYIVIDEVVTLADRMEKEVKNEFQGLLMQFVSQLPALGLRIFMVPHVVKDQILKKTITDLIPCRISVCGDPKHIEASTGAKPSEFPQRLSNMGDMAVKFSNASVDFVHAAVLAPTNEGTEEIFSFLARFWTKIEPESVKGSVLDTSPTISGLSKDKPKPKVSTLPPPNKNRVITKMQYSQLMRYANEDDDIRDIDDLF